MERITIQELNKRSANNEEIFVLFSAEWCGQCKMAKLLINKLKDNYKNFIFVEVDVDDENLWDHETLNIKQVPTFVGFKNKKIIFNASGYQTEENLTLLLNEF